MMCINTYLFEIPTGRKTYSTVSSATEDLQTLCAAPAREAPNRRGIKQSGELCVASRTQGRRAGAERPGCSLWVPSRHRGCSNWDWECSGTHNEIQNYTPATWSCWDCCGADVICPRWSLERHECTTLGGAAWTVAVAAVLTSQPWTDPVRPVLCPGRPIRAPPAGVAGWVAAPSVLTARYSCNGATETRTNPHRRS